MNETAWDPVESDLEDDFDDAVEDGGEGRGGGMAEDVAGPVTTAIGALDMDADEDDPFGGFAQARTTGNGQAPGLRPDGDDFGDFAEEEADEREARDDGADATGFEASEANEQAIEPPGRPPLDFRLYPPDSSEGAKRIRQALAEVFPGFALPDMDESSESLEPAFEVQVRAALNDLPRAPYTQPSSELVTRGDAAADELYASMIVPQELEPLDWKRSMIYRKQMIALGLPVNLDEVLPRAKSGRLGPLVVKMQATAEPVQAIGSGSQEQVVAVRQEAASTEEVVTDDGLPVKPEVDLHKIQEICDMPEDQCAQLPLAQLQAMSDRLEQETSSLSILIMHALREREALIQEGKDYNVMISDLVGWAAQATKAQQKSSRSVSGRTNPLATHWDNRQSLLREQESETSRGSALLQQRRGSTTSAKRASLPRLGRSEASSMEDLQAKRPGR